MDCNISYTIGVYCVFCPSRLETTNVCVTQLVDGWIMPECQLYFVQLGDPGPSALFAFQARNIEGPSVSVQCSVPISFLILLTAPNQWCV